MAWLSRFMAWLPIMPGCLFFCVVFFGIGSLLEFACGVKKARHYLYAPLATFAFLGIMTLLSPALPWTPLAVVCETLALAALILCVRCWQEAGTSKVREQLRDLKKDFLRTFAAYGAWLAAGLVVSVLAAWAILALSFPDPECLLQVYDNAFHYSIVRHIVDTGVASPIGAGSVAGSEQSIYPSLWHAMAALDIDLFGSSVCSASWIVTLPLVITVLPAGTVLLTRHLFPNAPKFALTLSAMAPALLPLTPYMFFTLGSLYGNLLGLALLPAAITLSSFALRPFSGRLSLGEACCRGGLLLLCVVALTLSHPNTFFVLAIVLFVMLFSQVKRPLPRIALCVALGVGWAMAYNLPSFARTVNCNDRIGDGILLGSRLTSVLHLDYDMVAASPYVLILVVAMLVVVAALAAWRLRQKWQRSHYLVTLAIFLALPLFALFPSNPLSRLLVGFWYCDAVRLYVILGTLLAPCAAAGIAYIPSLGGGAHRERKKPVKTCLAATSVIVAALFVACTLYTTVDRMAETYQEGLSGDDATDLTDERNAFLQNAASIVGDGLVLNDHCDASVWIYSLYGTSATENARSANWMTPFDDDYAFMVSHIAEYGEQTETGAKVRQLVANRGITHILSMRDGSADDQREIVVCDENGAMSSTLAGQGSIIDGNVPGLVEVLRQGTMVLYQIDGNAA